jgi:hypothetical protein
MNPINKSIQTVVTSLVCAVVFACLCIPACKQTPAFINDATITAAVSIATSTALKMGVKDAAKRTLIANYIEGNYADALRSITGNPTPENFAQQLNAFIPLNIQQEYPELVTFVNPIALFAYQQAYNKYKDNVDQISRYLNDVATGLQNGASQFATK